MARKPPHNAPKFSRLITAIAFTLIVSARAAGQNYTSFPHIKSLNQSDPVFLQLTELVEAYYRADGRGGPMHEVLFFQYRVKEEEDLFFIAARTNIGFAALATLNGLTHSNSLAPGDTIIIPSAPGIFIPTEARNELDKIMLLIRVYGHQAPILSKITFADGSVFHYIPGAKLNVMELAFFLGVLFRFPIPLGGTISSVFGSRLHPITGEEKFHSGIDIAAHEGTDVIAAREGTVSATGFHNELGRYIILHHGAGLTTVYGHLEAVFVRLNQRISSGTIIGTVGTSGISTGPHLHFEIRSSGDAMNPLEMIGGARR